MESNPAKEGDEEKNTQVALKRAIQENFRQEARKTTGETSPFTQQEERGGRNSKEKTKGETIFLRQDRTKTLA